MEILMEQKQQENSPIVYYTHDGGCTDWVLFLHPAFVDHRIYKNQYDTFAGKVNLLAIDLLGHGASMPRSKKDNVMQSPAWINAILKKEGIEKIHLVGISLGAVMAQLFANRYPQKLRSLACFGAQNLNTFTFKDQSNMLFSNLVLGVKGLISVQWFAEASKNLATISAEGQAVYVDIARQQSRKPFLLFMQATHKPPRGKEARSYPLLIGRGAFDPILPATAIEAWQRVEPSATAITIPNAGHLANLDQSEAFSQALSRFWSDNQP